MSANTKAPIADKYTIEFRIEGATLSPNAVSEKVGLRPCLIREPRGPSENTRFRNALWSFDGEASSGDGNAKEWNSLSEGLSALLDALLPKQTIIQQEFGAHDMYWWCGHFQTSFDGCSTLSPSVLTRLAQFGVPVILANYHSAESA